MARPRRVPVPLSTAHVSLNQAASPFRLAAWKSPGTVSLAPVAKEIILDFRSKSVTSPSAPPLGSDVANPTSRGGRVERFHCHRQALSVRSCVRFPVYNPVATKHQLLRPFLLVPGKIDGARQLLVTDVEMKIALCLHPLTR